MPTNTTPAQPQQPVNAAGIRPLPPVGQLFKSAWSNMTLNLKPYLSVTLVFSVVMILYTIVANTLIVDSTPYGQVLKPGLLPILFFLISLAIMLVVGAWIKAAIITIGLKKGKIETAEAIEAGKEKMKGILLLEFLVAFAVAPGYIVFFPGVYLSIALAFAAYVLIAEKVTGVKSLMRSKDLVAGYWWAVFGRYVLMSLVLGILSMIVITIVAAMTGGLATSAAAGSASIHVGLSGIVGGVVMAILMLFLLPYTVAYGCELYLQLVSIKGVKPPMNAEMRMGKWKLLIIAGAIVSVLAGFAWYGALKAGMAAQKYLNSPEYQQQLQQLEKLKGLENVDQQDIMDALKQLDDLQQQK